MTDKWDVHTHTTPSPATYETLGRFAHYADFIRVRAHATRPCCAEMVNSNGEVQRVIEENAYSTSSRLMDCDRHGVTMQVLSPTPMMIPDRVDHADDALAICRILNDANADMVADNPDRFMALGVLPMRHPNEALKELERLQKTLGIRGIEINSNIHGLDLDYPLFFPVFEAAADLGMAVFVHPWGGFMVPTEDRLKQRMNTHRHWRPWLLGMALETALAFDAMHFGGVHHRLPHLRVLYAHGGGAFPALIGRLAHGAYCRPDLFGHVVSADPYQTLRDSGVYVDTLVHDPGVLRMLIDLLGVDRIAMGSDYPYPLGELDPFDTPTRCNAQGHACPTPKPKGIYPGHGVEHLEGLTDAERQCLLSGTAKTWLGLAG
jgi:aminocarboxymuconate-semialdehyde decarboxylase